MNYELWINKAIKKIQELMVGDEFELKDLFLGVEWNELEIKDRRELGKRFKSVIKNNSELNISILDTKKGQSLKYRKFKK